MGFFRELSRKINKTCSLFNRVLAYKSIKVVRVIDKRMGLLVLFLRLLILGYLAVAVYLGEAYKVEEHTVGALVARASGETYSRDQHEQVRFWDAADALHPPTEVGAIFLATRVIRTNLQTMQLCANPMHPCSPENNQTARDAEPDPADTVEQPVGGRRLLSTDQDFMMAAPTKPPTNRPVPPPPDTTDKPLAPGDEDGAIDDVACSGTVNGHKMPSEPIATGQCSGDGRGCMEHIWCPAEGSSSLRTLDIKLSDLATWKLQFHSVIAFPVLADGVEPRQFSQPEMTIAELLSQVGAEEEEVLENGAVLSARVMYNCDLDEKPIPSCEPTVTLRRLDKEHAGFSYRRASYYYTDSGEQARDLQRLVGIRLQLSAYGIAKQGSLVLLILQCAIGMTLLGFANYLTDAYMCNICDDARFYRSFKIEDSDDFSDLAERLQNLDADEQRRLLEEKRRRQKSQGNKKRK